MKRLITLVALLALTRPAVAQTNYLQEIWAAGVTPGSTTAPIASNLYQASAFLCNQAKPAVPPTVNNPTRVSFDDPDPTHVGMACIAPMTSALLTALPNGMGYFGTMDAIDSVSGLHSGRSAASNPFNQLVPPLVRTNVKFLSKRTMNPVGSPSNKTWWQRIRGRAARPTSTISSGPTGWYTTPF